MSILDTGEVCMEFLKEHHSQELVKEVLRISCDGNVVSMFSISSLLCKRLRVFCSFRGFFYILSNYLFGNAMFTYAQL